MSSQVLVAQKGEKASVRFVLHGYGSLVCCSSGIIRQFQKGYSRKPADGFSKKLRGSEKAQKEDRGPLSPDPRACLISLTGTPSGRGDRLQPAVSPHRVPRGPWCRLPYWGVSSLSRWRYRRVPRCCSTKHCRSRYPQCHCCWGRRSYH